ncbi:MAG TPA: MFS transporter, partial [Thermodesulfobacteriota bacterium]|nr:MFS transporter [Thermodesulfobacteriota bacterium]
MKNFFVKKNPFVGLGKNVAILGLVSFFTDASSDMIYPLLPLFVTLTLGASTEMLGLIEGVAESTASLVKLFSGWLSDKLQKRKFLTVAGYSLASFARPLMAMALASWQVLFIRFIDRIGKGIRTSPRDALIADSTKLEFRGKAFGFHRAMDHGGAIVGPVIAMGILFLAPHNYRLVFWLATIPAVISVIILIVGVKEISPERTSHAPSLQFCEIDRNFRLYLGIVFLFTLGNSSDAFLLLRAK